MQTVEMGGRAVSRFILGSNPFSGFGHQGSERDAEMVHYYTCARIKEVLYQAEDLGINTVLGRADRHIIRVLLEYWDEGGQLQWFAQTCPELGAPEPTISRAAGAGAAACYIHGGYADHLMVNGRSEELRAPFAHARDRGIPVGLAGHLPETFRWAEDNLDMDFYMCSYYNPSSRRREAAHRSQKGEQYREKDRQAMIECIQGLSRPAIHYKVLAAGRNEPQEALQVAAEAMRPGDAVCVGIFSKDNPDMLREDVEILEQALDSRR